VIVVFIDNFDNFVEFLDRRITNEVFYEFKEIRGQGDLSSKVDLEIILHFLARAKETLILYETKQIITKNNDLNSDAKVINGLQKTFNQADSSLKLVKGKIREIFLSFTS
jgi:hypothetical protein